MRSCRIFDPILVIAVGTALWAHTPIGVDAHDPLQVIERSFPKTIEFRSKGRVLEFCPDNTCDGFVRSGSVPTAELKDFAFLYVYFFSDYVYLENLRKREDACLTAKNILSKPVYQGCQRTNAKESTRCVLLDLSRNKKIFVRYDENQRNVVNENIAEELAKREAQSP